MIPILLSIFLLATYTNQAGIWFITFINQTGVYHNIQVPISTGCVNSILGYGWAALINYVFPNGTAYVGGVYYIEQYIACPSKIGSPGTGFGYPTLPMLCMPGGQMEGYGLTMSPNYSELVNENIIYYPVSVSYPVVLAFQNGSKSLIYPSTWWYYLFSMPGYLQTIYEVHSLPPFIEGPLAFTPCFAAALIPASDPYTEYIWTYFPVALKVFVGRQQYVVYTTAPNKLGPFQSLPFSVPTPTITGLGVSPTNQSVPVGTYAVVNITEYGNAYIPPTLVFAGVPYCMYMPSIGLTEDLPGRYNGTVSVTGYLANFTVTFYQPTTTTHLPTVRTNYALVGVVLLLIIVLIAAAAYAVIKRRHSHVGVRL